jgi:phosphatidylglycerophosphate synthase
MFDSRISALIRPTVDRVALRLARWGISANMMSFYGFGWGLTAAYFISTRSYQVGLVCILISRICDALDGAIARQTTPTDRGAFLDITLDFLFYASIPLAFAWAAPITNGVGAATLLAAFMGTGSSFLAYAVLAEKRKAQTGQYPEEMAAQNKGFFYLGGLTEATETILAFCAMCIWPQYFTPIALFFAGLCFITILTRLWAGWKQLG